MGGDPPTLHGAAPEPDGSLCALPRSFDNSQICSCGSDKAVVLWDVASGQVVRKYRGHAGVSMEGGRGCGGGGCSGTGPPPQHPTHSTHPIHRLQKVNCVQFNEEATIIVSGEEKPLLSPHPDPPPDPPPGSI